MSTSAESVIIRPPDSGGDLSLLLETLRDINLSGDIFDESVYLDAHGGYCDIFTAKSRRHGNITVAVKRIRVHILRNKDASKMILRELRIWSSLDHPNVLPLLGYVMHGSYPALISQWMVNGSLRTYMEKFPNASIIRMAIGTADGLLYLHNQGIIHSDLKSDNILISNSGEPLLADFGISRCMTSTSTANTTTGVKGSARWMAIELLTPNQNETAEIGKHTMQTDVWAYGMVVYELLTGKVPFSHLKNDLLVSIAIARGQTPSKPMALEDERRALWSLCRACWQVLPFERPSISWIRDALSSGATSFTATNYMVPVMLRSTRLKPPPRSPRLRRLSVPTDQLYWAGNLVANNHDDQFIKSSSEPRDFRPPPEGSWNLDVFPPVYVPESPIMDQSNSSGTLLSSAKQQMPSFRNVMSERDKRSNRRKPIRIVAAEHKKIEDRILRLPIPNLPASVPEPPTAPDPKPIKWVRGELIGKGAHGSVYRALDAETGRLMAVKQIEVPKTDADWGGPAGAIMEAMKLEIETRKDLFHINIVQYLGFEETADFFSLFLEYVPGDSIGACLRKHGKFEDQIIRSFTGHVLDGLEYLHGNGIIHRDLRTNNIYVDSSGICKISGFHLSKRTSDIYKNGTITPMQGSVFWMAPEVVHVSRKDEGYGYGGKADVWSLGCVVLEMWAGRRPWQDVDAISVVFELISKPGAPPVPQDVVLTGDADDFRRKCFASNPDERPSATELRKHPYLTLRPDWVFEGFK